MGVNTELSVVRGSLADVASQGGQSLAEAFVTAEAVILCDVSGSMDAHDSRGGRSRYDVACAELGALQANLPGRLAVIAFSDRPEFVPGGVPPFLSGGTDLAAALRFAKVADVPGMRFIVISDGEPDNAAEALHVAATFTSRIDTVYVGPEAFPQGREFLERLAARHGGQSVTADRAAQLATQAARLLLSA
jgi:hypothetical protein